MWLAVHTAAGMGLARVLPAARAERTLAYGLILGAALPDFDTFPVLALVLLGYPLNVALPIHRALTHNLSVAAMLVLAGLLTTIRLPRSPRPRKSGVPPLLLGLGTGVLLHLALDVFPWGTVPLFFPFSARRVGVWGGPGMTLIEELTFEFALGFLFCLGLWWQMRRAGRAGSVVAFSALYILGLLLLIVTVTLSNPAVAAGGMPSPYLIALGIPYTPLVVTCGVLWWRRKTCPLL